MNISEFLEARIAEDEAALAAVPVAAQQSDDFDFGGTDDYLRFTMGYGRAVAECAAKRAIIVGTYWEPSPRPTDKELHAKHSHPAYVCRRKVKAGNGTSMPGGMDGTASTTPKSPTGGA